MVWRSAFISDEMWMTGSGNLECSTSVGKLSGVRWQQRVTQEVSLSYCTKNRKTTHNDLFSAEISMMENVKINLSNQKESSSIHNGVRFCNSPRHRRFHFFQLVDQIQRLLLTTPSCIQAIIVFRFFFFAAAYISTPQHVTTNIKSCSLANFSLFLLHLTLLHS